MVEKILRRSCVWLLGFIGMFVGGTVLVTGIYAVVNPPVTPLMLIRAAEDYSRGEAVHVLKRWKSYDEISPQLLRAVIAAEDTKFSAHEGFDWEAIEKAQEKNVRKRGRVYGASTISMQTAKNVFLWPSRSYLRKALEAYFTILIERMWSKRRILEVYVNVIEWGDGIYGAEAAARRYFGKSAGELASHEAALMAAVLPNPRRWSPAAPTPYVTQRQGVILSRMSRVSLPER